jgi:hypothetical protein
MPLSSHVLQYRCVLLGQLQIWRVVTNSSFHYYTSSTSWSKDLWLLLTPSRGCIKKSTRGTSNKSVKRNQVINLYASIAITQPYYGSPGIILTSHEIMINKSRSYYCCTTSTSCYLTIIRSRCLPWWIG